MAYLVACLIWSRTQCGCPAPWLLPANSCRVTNSSSKRYRRPFHASNSAIHFRRLHHFCTGRFYDTPLSKVIRCSFGFFLLSRQPPNEPRGDPLFSSADLPPSTMTNFLCIQPYHSFRNINKASSSILTSFHQHERTFFSHPAPEGSERVTTLAATRIRSEEFCSTRAGCSSCFLRFSMREGDRCG